MKKYLFLLISFIILFGCSKVDERGFYIDGKNKNLHKITKTEYNEKGYNIEEYNKRGFDEEGYYKNCFNLYGFNKEGIHEKTNTKYNEEGFNLLGYNENGYDKKGYNTEGFNKKGFDSRGFNRKRIHKSTKSKYDKELRDYKGNKLITDFAIGNYVDEWGDEIDKQFIYQSGILGTFSNSATHNSDAFLKIMIDKSGGFDFKISEYNINNRANVGEDPWLTIYTDKKEKFNFKLWGDQDFELSEQGTVTLYNNKRNNYPVEKLMKILKENQNVRIRIEGDYRSEYDFRINTTGLKEIAQSLNFRFERH